MAGQHSPSDCPFFTIGHSSRQIADFIGLLQNFGVKRVVDIRKMPASRANPDYNGASLSGSLSHYGIGYTYEADLGGLRRRDREVPQSVNGLWRNHSFHNYADYALSHQFRAALLDRLLVAGHREPCALMCAEALWWRCHRRIVTDYLLARGQNVFHIMGAGRLEPAKLTAGALIQADGSVRYPPRQPS